MTTVCFWKLANAILKHTLKNKKHQENSEKNNNRELD